MIVYDLSCDAGHRFEGWFGSSGDYVEQRERRLVACPECGSGDVDKAPMAPAVPRKGNSGSESSHPSSAQGLPAEAAEMLRKLAKVQAEALNASTWVGDDFPDQTRAMHYGERDPAPIHGQATAEQAKELVEEGIAVLPVLFPVAPPGELN
jgi:hypothetical protein